MRFPRSQAPLVVLVCATGACSALGGLDQYAPCPNCSAGEASALESGGPGDAAGFESSAAVDSGSSDGPSAGEVTAALDATSAPSDAAVDASIDAAAIDANGADAADAGDTADANEADGSDGGAEAGLADAQPSDAAGGDASDGGALSIGLVAWYTFDETSGTVAADSSGNGKAATMTGGAGFAPGLQGNAATMDGGSQYVSLPSGIVGGLTSFSIAAWIKLVAASAWTRLFDFGTGTTTYTFFTPVTAGQPAAARFTITTGGFNQEQRLDGPAFAAGTWRHVAVTLTGGTGTLYVDGAQAVNGSVSLTPSSLGTTDRNWLGRSQYPGDPYLSGQIDNVRIYSRALSAAEVQALYSGHL